MSEPNTKLMLLACPKWASYKEDVLFSRILQTVANIRKNCGHTFALPIPTSVLVREEINVVTRKAFWTKKEYEDKEIYQVYYLIFDKPLTEEELTLWLMFKIGYFAHQGTRK